MRMMSMMQRLRYCGLVVDMCVIRICMMQQLKVA
jgi:hypothetical protein